MAVAACLMISLKEAAATALNMSSKHSRTELAEALGEVWGRINVPMTVEELSIRIGAPAKNVQSILKKLVAENIVDKEVARVTVDGTVKKVIVFLPASGEPRASSAAPAATPALAAKAKLIETLEKEVEALQAEVSTMSAKLKAHAKSKRSNVPDPTAEKIAGHLALATKWHTHLLELVEQYKAEFECPIEAIRMLLRLGDDDVDRMKLREVFPQDDGE
ncbi:hypothetical protein J8273_6169 [Carpediemonas membranifera]|uniref:HTH marR-type domain-containing protein n=1 Tax=Carpediemonas membranifera TaxID=201153 RepID=A0A8J6B2C8_9EUKA|nr:hypothetical protein J8273_6169 [Carpediemonas membranifera]|eukprot:KAG9391409.1 hypothetical protein J8273_6169 [Carpediemonas membranifera]